jgi:hypothetical protein
MINLLQIEQENIEANISFEIPRAQTAAWLGL